MKIKPAHFFSYFLSMLFSDTTGNNVIMNSININKKSFLVSILFLATFTIGIVLQGNIPFLSLSTLGQSVAVVGYPISFLNPESFSIYASNMGHPSPAPMSTLLSPSLIIAGLINMGIHPADAFGISFVIFYTIGFLGAVLIGKLFGRDLSESLLLALLWMSFPIVWNSHGYSHLHFAFVIFPYFFYMLLKNIKEPSIFYYINYIIIVILLAFTDGYIFVFSAISSAILMSVLFFYAQYRTKVIRLIPIFLIAYASSYYFYSSYIGISEFPAENIDFFRGWGLDLSFLIQPSKGVHYLWDLLNLSINRTSEEFFGDASVWVTTFLLPIFLFAIYFSRFIDNQKPFLFSFIVIAIISLYFSLGPSIKFYSTKPSNMGPVMPVNLAVAETGSALISSNVPGFKNLRASYRWIVLTYLSLWLILLMANSNNFNSRRFYKICLILLIIIYQPNLVQHYQSKMKNYQSFKKIDKELIVSLSQQLVPGEVVSFLPYGNDFLVNYIAPSLNIKTYNIGGDKNLFKARENWPVTMNRFAMNTVDSSFADKILLLLASRDSEAVVLPYFDMLLAAHAWPPAKLYKKDRRIVTQELINSGYVDLSESELYSVVRLKPRYRVSKEAELLKNALEKSICLPPDCLSQKNFLSYTFTQVGNILDGKILSSNRSGFLVYGPYVAFDKGMYELKIFGKASVSNAWIDIVSDKGNKVHAKYLLENSSDHLLLNKTITLEHHVEDLELRIFVSKDDNIVLESYMLSPIKKH